MDRRQSRIIMGVALVLMIGLIAAAFFLIPR